MNIISDDSDTSMPRTRSKRTAKHKIVLQNDLISSDSDEDDHIVDKKLRQTKDKQTNQIMLGEISLLTSDDDSLENNPPKKIKSNKRRGQGKNYGTIDLISSDEEYQPEPKTNTRVKKRKFPDEDVTSPAKKVKRAPKTKLPVQKDARTIQKVEVKSGEDTISNSINNNDGASLEKPVKKNSLRKRNSKNSIDESLNISAEEVQPAWEESVLLAEKSQIDHEIALNLIKLWQDGNTIPFIARYRKNVIGNMSPEELRTTKEDYDEICTLKKKICTVAKTVAQIGKLDNKLQGNICAAKTIEELEHIFAPFKPEAKKTLAERAKKCGLEEPALHILNNTSMISLQDYVKPGLKDANTPEDVKKGIVHIIASEIATDTEIIEFLRDLRNKTRFRLQTKKARQTKAKEKNLPKNKSKKDPVEEEMKFEIYFDYSQRVDYLKSHQILAINRGESLKILTVKIEIPDTFENQFKYVCTKKWTSKSTYDQQRKEILDMAIDDAFQRLITPLISREIRTELKQKAEKESCKVFSDNLKHLLLMSPLKGKAILGIDPGYTNGCKLALISPTGSMLAHNVIYPHNSQNRGENVVRDMLVRHNCDLIAIGNGTACRKTEEWISELIRDKYFGNLDVKYTIVSEDGASIYSCSAEAKKEFGSLDPNIISAVSLARRIQDPMAELVKVEPSHLGIGMYQLDIKKKQLEEALNEVVSECVSFVGVDLNTASQCLLRRIAGLSDKKATQIIDYRQRRGPFTHRRQLVDVYGIGERVFEQCAGFLRVGPTDPNDTDFYKKKSTTPLDATIIHPESYPVVRTILAKLNLKEKDVGTQQFIESFKQRVVELNIEDLVRTTKTNQETIKLIFEALSKSLNHDLRAEVSKTPLFKVGVRSMEELETGMVLTGRVKNVTSFGAFVDIGVGSNGLVHTNYMKGMTVHLGDVVEVEVLDVDRAKKHIRLKALRRIVD